MTTSITSILPAVVEIAAAVFVLVRVQARAVGRARINGVIGAVLIIAGVVIPSVYNLALARRMSMESINAFYTLLFIQNAIRVLLLGAGLLLLVYCVRLSWRGSSGNPTWQGNPPTGTPYPTNYPQTSGPHPYAPQDRYDPDRPVPDNPPYGGQRQPPGRDPQRQQQGPNGLS